MPAKIKSYMPLPGCVTIGKPKLHGLGVLAVAPIDEKVDLGVTHIEDDRFDGGWIRTPLGGFMNYSSEPNCVFTNDGDIWRLVTLRSIQSGEELTAHYNNYDEATLASYE